MTMTHIPVLLPGHQTPLLAGIIDQHLPLPRLLIVQPTRTMTWVVAWDVIHYAHCTGTPVQL